MPYTLMKGLGWILLAVALGMVIGWLLRSVAAKRQIERARNGNVGPADSAELDRLRHRVANLEPIVGERDRLQQALVEARAPASSGAEPMGSPTIADGTGDGEAERILGRPIVSDDLTEMVGIGPMISDLCHGIGITTWAEMAETEVSLLRTMLNDAGQKFAACDPSTWPTQAGLLARGSWAEFSALSEELTDGTAVDRPSV